MKRIPFICCIAFLIAAAAGTAFAQSATAVIRGKVTNESGGGLANAEVSAVNTNTGFVVSVKTRADGSYQLGGIAPGDINLVVAAPGYEPRSEAMTIRVGQNIDLDLRLTATAVIKESITVVGNQLVETHTPEAATNVTPQQIENLPQNDRNFLNFAALAPGIRLSNDPLRKTIIGDAQPAEQTNIFIDGVSFKNDVLQGGVAGQDSSRGNPFPQNAVQEFRVITQNYSAQYDKASSAIITAVTKSGGNELDGQAFVFYQPRNWVAPLAKNFQYSTLATNDAYHRYQPGISIGGPIVKDKLHFFVSWESLQEHATSPVTIGNQNFLSQFQQYLGVFPSPFRSNLGFGKVSWQPMSNQLVDVSGTYRKEHEIRDFGNQVSAEAATNLANSVYSGAVRHQWNNSSALNQATLSWQSYTWDQAPLNPDLVGQDFEGVLRIGGNTSTQTFKQRRIELRDDFNPTPMTWFGGQHSLQFGGNVDFMKYDVDKIQNGNPVFSYRNDPANGITFAQPYQAVYGFGNPRLSTDNNQYGVYAQDNWTVNQHLTVNLGLRWDYESEMIDTNYVTPANIVAGLTGKVDPSYFSTGNERSPYTNEFQPRVGFSYDVKGDSKTVIFGGAGRYYDRLFLNSTLDERFRLQFPVYRIQFSPDGRPGTIKWDPKYMSAAGLDALIASGATSPEIYLLNNNTKPPYSNQFNIGVRQAIGNWQTSLSYNVVRGYHGFTWLSATGLCCSALVPGFGNVIISDPEGKRYWYDGVYLTLDRPYTSGSRWGARLAWTHAKATQNGNDLFSLDFPSAAQYPRHEVPDSERDHIVATGIVGLPWDVRLSSIITLGTGGATTVLDFSKGFSLQNRIDSGAFARSIRPPKTWGFANRSVDFRLEKTFRAMSFGSVGLVAEVFNAFNWANYGCLSNFIPPEGNPNLGDPGCVVNLGRREQVGLRFNF